MDPGLGLAEITSKGRLGATNLVRSNRIAWAIVREGGLKQDQIRLGLGEVAQHILNSGWQPAHTMSAGPDSHQQAGHEARGPANATATRMDFVSFMLGNKQSCFARNPPTP